MDKITDYVNKFHMIEAGESVVAGVSGGADSVCLLLFLKEYQKKVPFSLYCVHIEHGIREEAGEDAAYVKDLCAGMDIPFFLFHYDIPAIAKEEGLSLEEAGRIKRYEAFRDILHQCAKPGQGKIAVAHHKDDQAETVLFHLFRGSGLKGLAGMRPVSDSVIRPLLCVDRKEIEEELGKRGVAFQTDQTNFAEEYTRNKIRLRILPYAKEEINEKAVSHISEASEMMALADEYFSDLADSYLQMHAKSCKEGLCLSVEKLQQENLLVQKYIIKMCMEQMTGQKKDLTDAHVEAIRSLFLTNGTKRLMLPYGLCVKKEYDTLSFFKEKEVNSQTVAAEKKMMFSHFLYEKNLKIPEKKCTKWFSYDKIKARCDFQELELTVRTRRPGDYLVIDDAGHRKKIKEYMIEEKIPKEKRKDIPLLVVGSEVIWVVGYRINEAYKVNDFTKEVLEVQVEEDDDHGREN